MENTHPLSDAWFEDVIGAINYYQPHRQPEKVIEGTRRILQVDASEHGVLMQVQAHNDGLQLGYDLIDADDGGYVDSNHIPFVSVPADADSIAQAILAEIDRLPDRR